jgi:hypothetical protein
LRASARRRAFLGVAIALVIVMNARAYGQAACVGDCDASGQVTVDEITAMIAVALGVPSPVPCEAGDVNGDASITVDEIVAALTNALEGCSSQQLSGTCLVPGEVGLTGCVVGTIVSVFRCDSSSCDDAARTQIGSTSVQPPPDGGFVVAVDARQRLSSTEPKSIEPSTSATSALQAPAQECQTAIPSARQPKPR